MAIIHPFNYSIEDIEADHGGAEAFIINEINNFDKEKTKDWIFYYSFSFKSKTLTRHKDCEIDFLCLLPNIGIFVFEIKGGRISKTVENGEVQYYSLDRNGTNNKIKNPYLQARNNYYDFSNLLGKFSVDGSDLFITNFVSGYSVGFPSINQLEFSDPLGDNVITYTKGKQLYRFFLNLGTYYANANKRVPNKEDIDLIVKLFSMKNFTYRYDLGDYIDTTNVRINQLTDEQYTVLRGLLENDRCLINGPAGSGKTVLSEMLFKYMLNSKERVAYFSYNVFNSQKVKNDLEESIKDTKSICEPLVDYVGSLLKQYCPEKQIDDNNDKIKTLCSYSNRPDFPKFSAIIIDEAQDLEGNEELINLFDSLSSRGLKDGKVFVFFDKFQSIIYNTNPFYDNEIFGDEGFRYARFSLEKNCRNSENISLLLDEMRHLEGKLLIHNVNNDSVFYKKTNSVDNCLSTIKETVRDLKSNGVKASSITVLLTSRGINNTASSIYFINESLTKDNSFKAYSVDNARLFSTFTTVGKFKGLENDVIIYVRSYSGSSNRVNKSDYVAISRGKSLVYVLDIVES